MLKRETKMKTNKKVVDKMVAHISKRIVKILKEDEDLSFNIAMELTGKKWANPNQHSDYEKAWKVVISKVSKALR
jgi:hypothetical protein